VEPPQQLREEQGHREISAMVATKREVDDVDDSTDQRNKRKKVQNRESQKKYRLRQNLRIAEMERNLRDMQAILDSKLDDNSKGAICLKRIMDLSTKNRKLATGILDVRMRLSSLSTSIKEALDVAGGSIGPQSTSITDRYDGRGIGGSIRAAFKLPMAPTRSGRSPVMVQRCSPDDEYLSQWRPRRENNDGFMTHGECYDAITENLSAVTSMNMAAFERVLNFECGRLLDMLPGFRIFSNALGGPDVWPKPIIRWHFIPCTETYNMIPAKFRATELQLKQQGRYDPLIDFILWPSVREAAIVHNAVLGFDDLAHSIWECVVVETKYGAVRVRDYDDVLGSEFASSLVPEMVKNGIISMDGFKLLPDFITRLPFMAHEHLKLSHLPVLDIQEVIAKRKLTPLSGKISEQNVAGSYLVSH
jgi:hypothetical protein